MPLPTGNDLRPVDPLMTDYAIAYGPDLSADFVADAASPPVMAQEPTGTYFVWNKGDMYRREMKLRANGAESAIAGFRVSTSTYFCNTYALKTRMTDEDRARASAPMMADQAHTYYLMTQGKLNRDYVFKTNCFATGLWTSNTEQTGVSGTPSTNQFKQFENSTATPLKTLQDQMLVVRLNCGKLPNVMITNLDVMLAVARHADFTGRVTGAGSTTAPATVSDEQIAKILWAGTGVEGKIYVAKGIENTAAEGQTATMSDMFGKNILLAYVDPGANPLFDRARLTAFSNFVWSSYNGMTPTGSVIKSWRSEDPDGTWRRVEDAFDSKITANDAGVFLASAVG